MSADTLERPSALTRLRGRLGPPSGTVSVRWQVLAVAAIAIAIGFGVRNSAGPVLLAVLTVAACYALLALGTNVLLGWGGMVTFGQAAFFGTGAYTVALLRDKHWPTEVTLGAAVVAASLLGYVILWLLAQYTHIAFAMLTLVFGQFIYLLVSGSRRVGAADGLSGIGREPVFGIDVLLDQQFWWVVFAVLSLGVAVYWWLYRRVLALRLFGVREDAGRLATLGYNVRQLRAIGGAVSGAFAGAGGALFAEYAGAVSPTVLEFGLSGAAVFMCVIGGIRYLWGPLIGAVLYTLTVNHWLQSNRQATMYIGAIFVVVMIVLPNGLLSLGSLGRRVLRSREATR